jgi:hypothetical protein
MKLIQKKQNKTARYYFDVEEDDGIVNSYWINKDVRVYDTGHDTVKISTGIYTILPDNKRANIWFMSLVLEINHDKIDVTAESSWDTYGDKMRFAEGFLPLVTDDFLRKYLMSKIEFDKKQDVYYANTYSRLIWNYIEPKEEEDGVEGTS